MRGRSYRREGRGLESLLWQGGGGVSGRGLRLGGRALGAVRVCDRDPNHFVDFADVTREVTLLGETHVAHVARQILRSGSSCNQRDKIKRDIPAG